jgi:DNA-binding NarL/FixJ family response regulator
MDIFKIVFGRKKIAADVDPVFEDALTESEKSLVKMVADGLRNREIADKLAISENVVKDRLKTIFKKTGTSDCLELALHAIHYRLIPD